MLITDLGMDCVFTLDLATNGVAVCGKTGIGPGCFRDPAGLVVDSKGEPPHVCVLWVRGLGGGGQSQTRGQETQWKLALVRYFIGVGLPKM